MPLHIYKKPNGIWHIDGIVNGQRARQSTKTRNRDAAEAERKRVEADLERRAYFGARSFADAVLIYLEKGGEEKFIQPILDRFGTTQLTDITPQVVSAFALERYGNVEPSSVKRMLYTPLNAVINAAHRAQLCPFIRFEPPKVKRKPVKWADDAWLDLFFRHANYRLSLTVAFLNLTAARVTEACNLVVRDVDLAGQRALLRKTKNGNARVVAIQPELAIRIGAWVAQNALRPEEPVFGYSGRWSVNQAIERVCQRVNKRAGAEILPYLSSHKVGRHGFAARHLSEGKSLKFVRDGGGWASIRIVDEAYGHLERSQVETALRESGHDVLSKLGPAPYNQQSAHSMSHVSGIIDQNEKLLADLRQRHSVDLSGESVVGARGIEPLTPSMSRMTAASENLEKPAQNKGFPQPDPKEQPLSRGGT